VLAASYAAVLIANLPGHLTFDSLLELYEGRSRIRQTWAPSFYAWLLGAFDRLRPGAGLYVTASALLLFVALASFAWLRPRVSGWAALLAALFAASPLVLIYQAIVWKDVLFANAAVAGLVCLGCALQRWPARRVRWPLLAAALALLSAAALLRQNGVIVAVAAAAALGWTRAGAGSTAARWRRGLGWGLGALACVVLASHALDLATRPAGPHAGAGVSDGVRIVQQYDLMGALALDPEFPLAAVSRAAPGAARTLRRLAPGRYSAERIDTIDSQPEILDAFDAIPDPALAADWRSLILRPGLYLRERAEVFRWVFLTPRLDACLPVAVGVQGPAETLSALGMRARWSEQDRRLVAYDKALSFVHAHLAYAVIAAVAGVLLLRRGQPADLAMAALMAAALGFAASFFVISIACDYRYLYFLDLAAMTGALYLAVDPPRLRQKRSAAVGVSPIKTPARVR
jgi:hypothetical protein